MVSVNTKAKRNIPADILNVPGRMLLPNYFLFQKQRPEIYEKWHNNLWTGPGCTPANIEERPKIHKALIPKQILPSGSVRKFKIHFPGGAASATARKLIYKWATCHYQIFTVPSGFRDLQKLFEKNKNLLKERRYYIEEGRLFSKS